MSVYGFHIDWWNIVIALFYVGSLYFSENYTYKSALSRGIDKKDADRSYFIRLRKSLFMDIAVFGVLAYGFYESKYPYVPVGYVIAVSILYIGGTLLLGKIEASDIPEENSEIKKEDKEDKED